MFNIAMYGLCMKAVICIFCFIYCAVMKDDPLGLFSDGNISPEIKNSTPKSLNNSLIDIETQGLSSPPPSMDIGKSPCCPLFDYRYF